MTPTEKDRARRLAIMGAARLKFRDQRIALTEVQGIFRLQALTGRWTKFESDDGKTIVATEQSKPYWSGASLTEAEQAVRP